MTSGEPLNFDWPDALVQVIRDVLSDAEGLHELSSAVRSAGGMEPPATVLGLCAGLDYMQNRDASDTRGPYVPLVEWASGASYPRPIRDLSADEPAIWADALVLFGHESLLLKARLSDLLWCLRAQPRPDMRAREANEAMLALGVANAPEDTDAADLLVRALNIAFELNDRELAEDTVSAILIAIDRALRSADWAPGVPLTMIECLAALKAKEQPHELGSLINRARAKYASDPFVSDSILRLQISRAASGADRKTLALETVAIWRTEAGNRGGVVGRSFLEKALDVAVREGLAEVAHEIRVELQVPRTPEEMGMEAISAEVPIDRPEWDTMIDSLVGTTDGRTSLLRLAVHCPLGELEDEDRATRDLISRFPLHAMFDGVVTDRVGLPIVHVVSEEQKFDRVRFRNRALAINLWSVVVVNVLEEAKTRGIMGRDQFREAIDGELINGDVASGLTAAFEHYLRGGFEEATLMVLPRIEIVLRTAAREIGLAIYEEPSLDGTHFGKYKALGKLLHELQGWVPEEDRQYLLTLLVDPRGHNLRNEVMHGLRGDLGAGDAALAIHAALVLARWGRAAAVDDVR